MPEEKKTALFLVGYGTPPTNGGHVAQALSECGGHRGAKPVIAKRGVERHAADDQWLVRGGHDRHARPGDGNRHLGHFLLSGVLGLCLRVEALNLWPEVVEGLQGGSARRRRRDNNNNNNKNYTKLSSAYS